MTNNDNAETELPPATTLRAPVQEVPADAPASPKKRRSLTERLADTWRSPLVRRMARWGAAYIAIGFGVLQGVALVSETMDWPRSIVRATLALTLAGFPAVLILAGQRARISKWSATASALFVAIGIGAAVFALQTSEAPQTAGPSAPAEDRLAVLRFDSLGDTEPYFAEGVADELIAEVSRVPGLDVSARASSFALSGENATPQNAARQLGATMVMTGSVRKLADAIRVHAQLVEAPGGKQIWNEIFERKSDEVMALQRDIAIRVAQAAGLRLKAPAPRKVDPEAYRLYLSARERQLRGEMTDGGARDLLRGAVERDPNFAEAWSVLAYTEYDMAWSRARDAGKMLTEEDIAPAIEAANHAIGIDSTLAEPYKSKAGMYSNLGKWNEAAVASDAAQRNGASSNVFLLQTGRIEEALSWTRRGVELDPLEPYKWNALAYNCSTANDVACWVDASRHALEIVPDDLSNLYELFRALVGAGEKEQARKLLQDHAALLPALYDGISPLDKRHIDWMLGDGPPMPVADLVAPVEAGEIGPGASVEALVDIGEFDQAARLLTYWGPEQRTYLFYLYHWKWAPIRKSPEFWALMERMGLLQFWRESGRWPDFCAREPICPKA